MTAITFPNSPSSGDTHTAGNGIVYTYDGEKWTSIGTNSAGTWTRSGTEVSLTNAGDDLNVDNGTLFVDASTDRVGIGTTDAKGVLRLAGSSVNAFPNNGGILWLTDTNAASDYKNWEIGSGSGELFFARGSDAFNTGQFGYKITGAATQGYVGEHIWYTNNSSEKARIDNSGRLLVGTTSPTTSSVTTRISAYSNSSDWMLMEVGAISGTNTGGIYGVRSRSASNNPIAVASAFESSSAVTCYYGGGWGGYGRSANELRFFTSSAVDSASGTTGNERMQIDSSGRLLVGTSIARTNFFNSTESSQVQVEGTSTSTASLAIIRNSNDNGYPILYLAKTRGTSAGSTTIVQSGDYVGGIEFQGSDGTQFVQAASIRGEVDSTPGADDMPGRLVFSTTPDGASNPTEKMRINEAGTVSSYAVNSPNYTIRNGSPSGASVVFIQGLYSATSPVSGGAASFYVFTNGNVLNTNNSYGAISDVKLKENIVDASSQWDDIKALQIRKYNFIGGQTHTQIGVVAQEVEIVSPGLVTESPDRDEEGNDLGTVTKSVNYSVLYIKAVKALQEAMERIETLEQRLSDAGIA